MTGHVSFAHFSFASFFFLLPFLNHFFRAPYIRAINLLYYYTYTFSFTNYHLSFDFFYKSKDINNFNSYKFKFLIFPSSWHFDICCLKCQISLLLKFMKMGAFFSFDFAVPFFRPLIYMESFFFLYMV